MFILDSLPIPYSDPWKKPLERRLSELTMADRRVAYFYESPNNSTFRYRVYNMIEVLQKSDRNISAAYFCAPEMDRLEEMIDLVDVLVICRSRYTDRLNQLVTRARNKGKRVFYDVDDLVFDLDYVHLILATLDQDLFHPGVWDHWYAYVGRIGAVLRMCDRVIVTNDYLASRAAVHVSKPVSVIPNFLNEQQMSISRHIFEEKRKRHFRRTEEIHVGYFSGTPTHNKDFEIVSGALAHLLAENSRLRVKVVGFLELGKQLREYSSRIDFIPLQDFVNLQRIIGSTEINLVPLQDNVFTNCKSELKYFEAGIVGTVTIASPSFTLARAIQDGENGYLANSYQWEDKLGLFLDNLDFYPTMAEKAFVDCQQKYDWRNQLNLIEATLFS